MSNTIVEFKCYFFSQEPTIRSEFPAAYMFDVSIKFPPSSANLSKILCAPSSSCCLGCLEN